MQATVKDIFPDNGDMHLPDQQLDVRGRPRKNYARHHHSYAKRRRWNKETAAASQQMLQRTATPQAVQLGLWDREGEGSWTHPHPSRIVEGDGTTIPPLYKSLPGTTRVVKATGEVRPVKSDPEARYHYHNVDGKKKAVRGTKFNFISVRGDEPHLRMILDVAPVTGEGAEAAVAMESLTSLLPMMPGAQSVAWDMIFGG
jgi:hypothetical protein